MKKSLLTIISVLMIASLCACSSANHISGKDILREISRADIVTSPDPKEMPAYGNYKEFIGEKFYDKPINNDLEAAEAIESVADQIRLEDNSDLLLIDEVENEEGTKYYFFTQVIGSIKVYSSAIKLAVDKGGNAIGLVSSLAYGYNLNPEDKWEIDEAAAEKIVEDKFVSQGASVIKDATAQILLTNDEQGTYMFVWLVFTNNINPDADATYMAHYVRGSGEYLYSIPVSDIGDNDAYKGVVAPFAFTSMESDTWTGNVPYHNNVEREITVPVMIDQQSGKTILGDVNRRIVCADAADYLYKDTFTPITKEDGFFADDLNIYYNFLRVYDLYADTGWDGPDGEGTPVLLLMNNVDENGNPVDNAFYNNESKGFQVFLFSRGFGDGMCLDTIGHEFTHCVTRNSQGYNIYQNDLGAINEAFSDIMGNLIEMKLGDSPGGEWLIGENASRGALRSMKDPHKYLHPEYVWDEYYRANTEKPSDSNDLGGVHTNSSILNMISYELNEAGMSLDEQFYYWMNVALAMTPYTDYPQLAEIMPWTMKTIGYDRYLDALNRSIARSKIENHDFPENIQSDQAVLKVDVSSFKAMEKYSECDAILYYIEENGTGKIPYNSIWEDTSHIYAVLPANDYAFCILLTDGMFTEDYYELRDGKWTLLEGDVKNLFTEGTDYVKVEAEHYYEFDMDKIITAAS